MATLRFSLCVLLCTATVFLGTRAIPDLETSCAQSNGFPLHFDLFMELVSNHTSVETELTRAPIFGDMDRNVPAYEVQGTGIHFTDPRMSRDIRRALCSNNEVTFYSSMYLLKTHSSGTLLEISSGRGARLPVFGVYFNGGANEIMFTYRHRGTPHTISIDQRLHRGRWRQYAFVLSGHLLQFYFDCQLVFSDVVPLPDFCIDGDSFYITFADDSEGGDVSLNNGIFAYFQKVGFSFGRGGLGKQCPGSGKECPTCGQYLKLVEKAYKLQAENDRLKEQLERRGASDVPSRLSDEGRTPCDVGGQGVVADGSFIIMSDGICFCQGGRLQCNPNMECEDTATSTPVAAPPLCNPECTLEHQTCVDGTCQCERGFSFMNGECVEDRVCEDVNDEDLVIGQKSYLYRDQDDTCRVFTCREIEGFPKPIAPSEVISCTSMDSLVASLGCHANLTDMQRNLSICCQNCTPCDFLSCGENSHCRTEGYRAECFCDDFYRMNEEGECVDIHECELGTDDCGEFEVCVNLIPKHRCDCREGYNPNDLGDCQNTDECLDINTCPTNSECTDTDGSFTCDCNEGYIMTDSDPPCSPVCEEPCQNGGTCVAPETCTCLSGYTGHLCEEDVDECETDAHMCTHPLSDCVNTVGGYFCRCRAGYQGNGTYCKDINECESDIHNCIRRGPGDCLNTDGSFTCSCDNMDCTGSCRRRGNEYAHEEAFIDDTDMCNTCTCLNGEIICNRRSCDGNLDCSNMFNNRCCANCTSRDCYLQPERSGHSETVVLRPNSVWVDPSNPCTQWKCDSKLMLTRNDLSSQCPPLQCLDGFRAEQPGRCCSICLLPSCNGENEGLTQSYRNRCEQCTCESGNWRCSDMVSCPGTSCAPEDILFYDNNCCPVCESDIDGTTCQSLAN